MSARETSTFAVLPAIDLRSGRVVRLEQGDFQREQVFAEDPGRVAGEFADAGATWLHVVDLDGARDGGRRQVDPIRSIVDAVAGHDAVRVQVAGGLRDADAIATTLDAGAARVVLGTIAITNPDVVRDAIARHGADRIAAAIDVRDGQAVGDGWVPGGPARPFRDLLDELTTIGVRTVVVTAIARDGLLGGPDTDLLAACVAATGAGVIASGGIRSIEDLAAVRALGCAGAIVGRAVYDGRIDLRTALRATAHKDATEPSPSADASR